MPSPLQTLIFALKRAEARQTISYADGDQGKPCGCRLNVEVVFRGVAGNMGQVAERAIGPISQAFSLLSKPEKMICGNTTTGTRLIT